MGGMLTALIHDALKDVSKIRKQTIKLEHCKMICSILHQIFVIFGFTSLH